MKYTFGSYGAQKFSFSNQGVSQDGKIAWTISANDQKKDGFYRNGFLDGNDVNLNLTYNFTNEKKLSFALTDSYKKDGVVVGNNRNVTNANGWDPAYPEVAAMPAANTPSGYQYLDGSYRESDVNNYSVNYNDKDWKLGIYQNKNHMHDWYKYLNGLKDKVMITDNTGYNWQKSWQIKNHNLTTGIDYRKMKVDYKNISYLKSDLNGYYIQDNWKVNDKTLVGLGLRYDRYESTDTSFDLKNHSSDSQISPKVNMTYQLNAQEAVYGSVSRVFRTPAACDYVAWRYNYTPTGYDYRGSTYKTYTTYNNLGWSLEDWQNALGQLKPEYGMAYELGWKKQFSPNFSGKVTGFFNDINNYITWYEGSGLTSGFPIYNIDNAQIKGVEVIADYQFDKRLGAVFSYTNQHSSKSGDNLDPTGTDINTVPKEVVKVGFRYNDQRGFQASLDGIRIQKANRAPTSGYSLCNLGLSYTQKDSTIALNVNNLFDVNYQQTKGFPMPGINYNLSYQIGF